MNSKLIFTMATCAMASLAFAQEPSNGSSTAAKIANPAAPTAQAVPANAAAQPAGESTATLSTTVPSPKKFGLSFSIRGDASAKSFNQDKDPEVLGVHRLTGSYSFTDTQKIRARGEVTYKYPKTKDAARERGEAHVSDPWIGYVNTKLLALPAGWNLSVDARQYMPFGENSRFVTKQAGMSFAYFIADKSIGKFDLSLNAIPYYWWNSQDYSVDRAKNKISANYDTALESWFGLSYTVIPSVKVSHNVGLYNYWMRGIPVAGVERRNFIYNETGVEFAPNKTLTFSASVENDAKLEANNAATFYRDDDTTYRALMAISI